jgi:flagellar biogenesis protein FliO
MMANLLPALAVFVGGPILIWWLRRGRATGGSALRVVARTALTRGSVVAVVESAGRRLLVGATDHGISVLSELDATDGADAHTDGTAPAIPATIGPRTSPLEAMRAMTVRRPARPRPIRVLHR